jgi:serine/threonine protein kinase
MKPGETIKERYRVESVHSDEGGMGQVLLVIDLQSGQGPLALKYCRETDEESLHRFQREARLMQTFTGNKKVAQLLDAALEHEPPFIVMPFYQNGDLRTFRPEIESGAELQEKTFLSMVDCVNELHRQQIFHRDIKPQNFLRDGDAIVVSDFGLGMEMESRTQFTRSSQFWGTPGYTPPEFIEAGGFKNATAASDVFMLGKSFYALVTGRDPQFINDALMARPLAFVVDKCCKLEPDKRFTSLAQLRQALVSAYNIILGRVDAQGKGGFLLEQIVEQLKRENKYDPEKVLPFLEFFENLNRQVRWVLVQAMPKPFFFVMAQPSFQDKLIPFLLLYEEVVMNEPGDFGYAETVAENMEQVFKYSQDSNARAKAFEIAVKMAVRMNRFAAMDTCVSMIDSVAAGDPVGAAVASVITLNPEHFLKAIEPVTLKNAEIRAGVQSIKGDADIF